MQIPIVVKTSDHATLDHLLEKHGARVSRHEAFGDIEYRVECPKLPGDLIITPDDLHGTAAYAVVLTKFVEALDAEGIEP